jgi:hypothetical protein
MLQVGATGIEEKEEEAPPLRMILKQLHSPPSLMAHL